MGRLSLQSAFLGLDRKPATRELSRLGADRIRAEITPLYTTGNHFSSAKGSGLASNRWDSNPDDLGAVGIQVVEAETWD
jgi:hypothetical protein